MRNLFRSIEFIQNSIKQKFLPHILSENISPVLMFSSILIVLSVVFAEDIKVFINMLGVTTNKFAHWIKCVDMINTRSRETMTLTKI